MVNAMTDSRRPMKRAARPYQPKSIISGIHDVASKSGGALAFADLAFKGQLKQG
jgi:hypothetical protein